MSDMAGWIAAHEVSEVECLTPDMNGALRGKVVSAADFLRDEPGGSLRLASSALAVTLTGAYAARPGDDEPYRDPDMALRADARTLRLAPGQPSTAWVFADACHADGRPWESSPRHVLKAASELYARRGWRPVTAPELEFYLTAVAQDANLPPTPPMGGAGTAGAGAQPCGLEALDEFAPVLDAIYEDSLAAGLELGALSHESGAAQLEINFVHGDPILLADQVVLFKRIVRRAARKKGLGATFMAKPMADQPGSAMHLHISVEGEDGINLFADDAGEDTPLFRHFVGGLQKYLPQIAPLYASNVNAFRRMRPRHSQPVNVEWARDNRSCGLRVPLSGREGRRIENRLPGADANPYLAIAAALIAGHLGIEERLEPSAPASGNAYRQARGLPRTLEEALERFAACKPVRALLGEPFFTAFMAVKEAELEAFQTVVTPWEREYLLQRA